MFYRCKKIQNQARTMLVRKTQSGLELSAQREWSDRFK